MPLRDIKENQMLTIRDLTGDSESCQRLQALGFIPGSLIKVMTKLPFNGPILFELRGTRIAIRQKDAACLQLQYV